MTVKKAKTNSKTEGNSMSDNSQKVPASESMRQIQNLLNARVKLIYVVTSEEKRFIEDLYENVIKNMSDDTSSTKLWLWSSYEGLIDFDVHATTEHATGTLKDTPNPIRALQEIVNDNANNTKNPPYHSVYLMRDMHVPMAAAGIQRQLRDTISRLKKKTIIVVAPEIGYSGSQGGANLPLTLDKDIVVVEYNLMSREDLEKYITGSIRVTEIIAERYKGTANEGLVKSKYSKEEKESLIRACQGLTEPELQVATKTSIAKLKKLDPEYILKSKEQIIKKSGILEYINTEVEMNDVGGLDKAKEYFETYKNSFSDSAREYGVEPPSGVLLTGIPGSGKSLLAKAICRAWGLPGIRLDIGKVMTGLVGGSEAKMREAIKQAEAVAPCIVWLDEVEKAMSGVKSSNFSDAGTMSRVFGTFLTWMQEKTADVVVVATANDITSIPPEFIRRFNEVFFVDLPVKEEREEIFRIHLRKRNRDPNKFKYNELVEATKDYTGAEIEKAIKHAIAVSFLKNDKDVTEKRMLEAIRETKPISQIMEEKIRVIRDWAKNRARYASSTAENANKFIKLNRGKSIAVDDAMDLSGVINSDVQSKKSKSKTTDDTDVIVS